MKLKIIVIILASLIVTGANANKSVKVKHFKDHKRESLKCYLVMENGNGGIIKQYNLLVGERGVFKQQLLNKKFKSNGSFLSVSEVKECVKIDKKFKDIVARRLDNNPSVAQ